MRLICCLNQSINASSGSVKWLILFISGITEMQVLNIRNFKESLHSLTNTNFRSHEKKNFDILRYGLYGMYGLSSASCAVGLQPAVEHRPGERVVK